MAITPELRKMLGDRAQLEQREAAKHRRQREESERTEALFATIDAAAPYLDAGPRSSSSWATSTLIKIGYCVLATSDNANRDELAAAFVDGQLTAARELYRLGFYADPFAVTPTARPR